jgi:NAD(P)-dependent dehydrogenase (short-subunit alcohol dehydrogenase family)
MGTSLQGKVALVTGAASGIGRAITERFVADGASVLAADIDADGLAGLADVLGVATAIVDVTDEDQQAAGAAAALQAYGRLDIAVANAGAGFFAPILDHPVEEWRRILDLCVTGVMLTFKHAGRAIVGTGDGGSMIAIASLNAVQPSRGMAAYCAAKSAVTMLTEVAAMELGPHGIRVNAIAPGLVRTAATSGFFAAPGVVEEFVENTTVGRFAEPAEIAAVAAFLAGPESSFVSASTYAVDGGARTGRYPNLFRLLS